MNVKSIQWKKRAVETRQEEALESAKSAAPVARTTVSAHVSRHAV